MFRWHSLLCLAALACFTATASAQVPPEKALATFAVADGLELSLWASEPMFANPTSIDIDRQGRVWVCEAVNYRFKLRNKPPLRKEGDRILILSDSKGTGKADTVTTFYQGPELMAPLGIAVAESHGGPGCKVYVCQSPDILLFEDKNGDGKADGPPTKFLTGFQGIDHDHGVHSIYIGPDNRLYFTVGDAGVNKLKGNGDKDRVYSSNSTDCRAGTVWRCDLDGKNLTLVAHNFRNNYECCTDSFGRIFLSDNDDDGNQQTRICFVMPGGNYGYHPRGPGQTHWHEEQPGVVHKILRTGFGSPTGICVYEGSLLPAKYKGQLLHTDAGPRHLRCYHMKPNGAGFDVEQEILVSSSDNWFRPSDVCVAPDGSVFMADWYDPGVGGHGMGDTTRGRIYRLTPKGHNKADMPKVDLTTEAGLLAALNSPNLAVRHMAMERVAKWDRLAFSTVSKAAQDAKEPILRARALWQLRNYLNDGQLDLAPQGTIATKLILDAATNANPETRLAGLLMMERYPLSSAQYLTDSKTGKLLPQPSLAHYREALLRLREVDAKEAAPLIMELAKQYDGKDRFYLSTIGIAVGTDTKRRDAILADFEKHFPTWDDRVADLVWELRPSSVIATLNKRLTDPTLSDLQQARVVDILAAGDDKAVGKQLLDFLKTDVSFIVQSRILSNLEVYLPGKWRDLRSSEEMTKTIDELFKKDQRRTTALFLIGKAERVDKAKEVIEVAKKGSGGDQIAAIIALGSLPTTETATALEALLAAEATVVRGQAARSLATMSTLKAQGGAPGQARKALETLVKNDKAEASLRLEAVDALVGTYEGTVWLLELAEGKKLPDAIRTDTARMLRNTPFAALRPRALIAFPPPNKIDPKKLAPVATLMKRQGNVEHGRQVLAASGKTDMQCLKCHSVQGTGGAIGPDLSMIGKKASRENMFDSLITPNKAIADQYLTWAIETKQGVALTGLIVEETGEHIVLRDANGKDTKIDKKQIDTRAKSPNSLMPNDLIAFMTEEELVDVVEYLMTLKTPVLTPEQWHIVGPFDNGQSDAGFSKDFGPEKKVDLKEKLKGKSGEVQWGTVKPNGVGYVDLLAYLGEDKANHSVSYLYNEIESTVEQEVTLLVGNDDACKVWVNEKLVLTDTRHVVATPEMNRVTVKLAKGINRVLVKITNAEGTHGLYFSVLSDQELKRTASN